ncbi:MAG: hypothetical protein GXO23_00805 [Crenarchaeota archaeon]|nr:hypothetical protein [Thermoproteota archaeon]
MTGESRYSNEDVKKILEDLKNTISELREKLSKKTFVKAIGGRRLAEKLTMLVDIAEIALQDYGPELVRKYLSKKEGKPFRE